MNVYQVSINNRDRVWNVEASSVGTAVRRAMNGEPENQSTVEENYPIDIKVRLLAKNMTLKTYNAMFPGQEA